MAGDGSRSDGIYYRDYLSQSLSMPLISPYNVIATGRSLLQIKRLVRRGFLSQPVKTAGGTSIAFVIQSLDPLARIYRVGAGRSPTV